MMQSWKEVMSVLTNYCVVHNWKSKKCMLIRRGLILQEVTGRHIGRIGNINEEKIEYAIGLFMFLSLIFGLQLLENGSLNLSNKNTEEKDVPVSMGQRKKEIFVYSENIKNILEKRGDEEIAFLNKYPTALRWIRLSSFDFNGDGVGEIILSDEYVETSTIVSYNQVYDVGGKLLFRFVAGDILDTEVFVDEVGSKYHIQSSLHIAAGHDVTFYERIFGCKNKNGKRS